MSLKVTSSADPIRDEVDAATNENSEDNWGQIMNICDKAGKSSEDAKNYLRVISKRLFNNDPHVALKAVTLLDACIKNSGKNFHIEVASREFEDNFLKLMTKAHPNVASKLRESLKKWSESEFKNDPQLNLIPSLYTKLKNSGHDFSSAETSTKKAAPLNKDPNVVESQEEEDEILKAIELSLKETSSPKTTTTTATTSSSLYPTNLTATMSQIVKEPRKVRALYDFEAAEDNELTFNTGEIIVVLDDSDANWWKGSNHRGEGLFPSNFVTDDLNVEPEKKVQFKETIDVKNEPKKEEDEIEINEEKIDRLLHLFHEADPTNPEQDTEEMLKLEREVNGMGPLIDSELERVDRKHAQLTQLSLGLVEALGLYHTLMREPQFTPINKIPYPFPPTPTSIYNGGMPPQQHPPPTPHTMLGPSISAPGLHPHDNRLPFMQQPSPGQFQPLHFPINQQIATSLPPQQQPPPPPPPGMVPPDLGLPPNIHPRLLTYLPGDRNMVHYASYAPQTMLPPNFQPMGTQPVMDNNQQQQQIPQFIPDLNATRK